MSPDEKPMVLILSGSQRNSSFTFGLCLAIRDQLEARNFDVNIWDCRERPLPIADPEYHHIPDRHPDPEVRALVNLADRATAVVLATPVYHNGPSGLLKNMLDHLTIRQFAYKPVGLASHGGARTTQALEQLRIVTRGLLGHAIVTQVCTDQKDFEISDETGKLALSNSNLLTRVERFADELSVMAQVMAVTRKALV